MTNQITRGRLTLQAAAADPVLTTAEAKSHLRVDISTDDTLIDSLVGAATQRVENFTRRALVNQTWDLYLDDWPSAEGSVVLPRPPFISLTSITYTDPDGASQTLDVADDVRKRENSGPFAEPSEILPLYGATWPDTRDEVDAIRIRFVAGYGAAGTDVPEGLRSAVRLIIGHLYEHREEVVIGAIAQELPDGIESLLWPFRADW